MEIEVASLSEQEARVLECLAKYDKKHWIVAFHEIAADLSLTVGDVANGCRRLEMRGWVKIQQVLGDEENFHANITNVGRVAVTELRALPERLRVDAAANAKRQAELAEIETRRRTEQEALRAAEDQKHRRERVRMFFLEKLLAPIVVAVVMLFVGRCSVTSCSPPTAQTDPSPASQRIYTPVSSQAAPTSQPIRD